MVMEGFIKGLMKVCVYFLPKVLQHFVQLDIRVPVIIL